MSDSQCTLVGNASRDPELRFTKSGQAVASFGLAINRKWTNKSTQETEESTTFVDIVAWGSLGENVSQSISRGMRVIATGRLEQRSWETDSGETRSKIELVADEVAPSLRWATAAVTKTEKS